MALEDLNIDPRIVEAFELKQNPVLVALLERADPDFPEETEK